MAGKRPGFARQLGKNCLCDILGPMGIAVSLPQGGSIDESEMAPDQFNEGLLRVIFGIAAE